MKRIKILMILGILLILPTPSFAVNFYDGARAQGLYFLTYSSLYDADKTNDSQGHTSKKDYGYRKLEELFRFCYYRKNLVLTGLFPVGHVKNGFYHESSAGIGDINLGAGYFLPVKQVDLLPMLFVEFPTGDYDSQRSVNYGTNQYDIKPILFIYKAMGRFSVDAAAKYFFRTENPGVGVTPGDEFYLQGLLGWQFTKKFKAGPSLSWMKSGSQKNDGVKVNGSQRESLSAGADFYFRFPAFSATFTYLREVRAKNNVIGDFFQFKTCYKF
ncbi:MAG: transporter [Candidatus Omnitrophica bacterium]|nr:transporter [Candidatus Omnitrophota bacterium]